MSMGNFQGAKLGMLGRQNERNSSYVRMAYISIFRLCFMSVCLMKSNCYSLIYSSLIKTLQFRPAKSKHNSLTLMLLETQCNGPPLFQTANSEVS